LALEVEFFTQEELRKQFNGLLQSYRSYHQPEPHASDVTAEDREDLENNAKAAEDTFNAAFRDRIGENEGFRLDGAEALETLMTWVASIGLPVVEGINIVPRTKFSNTETFSQHLMELTSEPVEPTEPSKWPFIRKIR
jgi:hypothetical protein